MSLSPLVGPDKASTRLARLAPRFAPRQDVLHWFHDVRSSFECFGIGWAVWSYDEEFGLNRRRRTGGGISIDREVAAALGLNEARSGRVT